MRWLLPLLSIVVAVVNMALLYYFADLQWDFSLIDSIISTFILATCVWGMLLAVNAYPTRVGSILYSLIIATFFSALAGYGTWQALRLTLGKNNDLYMHWLSITMFVRYISDWLICGWVATFAAMQKEAETLEKRFMNQNDVTNLHREAELYKLRQQLQPHFLYNSLNSISALTMIEPSKAQDMIGKLSDFLRSSVKREGQEKISLTEELQYIEAYLAIESVRFGDRLKIEFGKDHQPNAEIPPFLLQPVLENAIKFGLYGRIGQVVVKVTIMQEDGMLYISVTNPYDKENQPQRGTGFGLEGIKRRLFLLYARTDLLEVTKNDDYFTTTLKIPQTNV